MTETKTPAPPQSWTVYDLDHPKGYRTFYNEEAAKAYSKEISNRSKGDKPCEIPGDEIERVARAIYHLDVNYHPYAPEYIEEIFKAFRERYDGLAKAAISAMSLKRETQGEISGNDPLDTVLKEPGEIFPKTLRQHIDAISRYNVSVSARDVWRILDALLPLVRREPKRESSDVVVALKALAKYVQEQATENNLDWGLLGKNQVLVNAMKAINSIEGQKP